MAEEPHSLTPRAADRSQKRADKARAKEQKRADRTAAREQGEAQLARLNDETFGKVNGFRVFKDGSVQKEKESPVSSLPGSSWVPAKFALPTVQLPRSAVVDVSLDDHRKRKLLRTIGGNVTYLATKGYFGTLRTGATHGKASLTVATDRWIEVITAESDAAVEELENLNQMILKAIDLPDSKRRLDLDHQTTPPPAPPPQPAPSPPPSEPASHVPSALRELKGLHDDGILTDDEYEVRRQVLLSRLHED